MGAEILKGFFLWCTIINLILFILSFLSITFLGKWIYRIHGKWYGIREENFSVIFYTFMLYYKIAILFFNFVPYLALVIITG